MSNSFLLSVNKEHEIWSQTKVGLRFSFTTFLLQGHVTDPRQYF